MNEINLKVDVKAISINKAFQGQRFKTKECKEYEKELLYQLPKKPMIEGEIEIWFDFFLINYARTDISNLIKVTEDLLVKRGYFEDDRKIVKMHISKEKREKDMMTIKIKKTEAFEYKRK